MTYYNPHPAHVLVGDSMFNERKVLGSQMLSEKDFMLRYDLAKKLVGKYTSREARRLYSRLRLICRDAVDSGIWSMADWKMLFSQFDESERNPAGKLIDLLTVADMSLPWHGPRAVWLSVDMLADPDSRLPTSDIHGEEDQHGRV